MTDFQSLIRLLAGSKVEYILVGGAAATAHGSARLTQDLDIVYRRSSENMARLAGCLSSHHPYLRGARGVKCRCLGLDRLIQVKRAAGRPT